MISKYNQTLDYIYKLLPMYSRIGAAAYKKDLSNTLALLEAIDNPHLKLKCVHVAGTNGKGTTSHIIAYGLQCQGLKVGLYTSPHYIDFRERIKINGDFISKKYVINFIESLDEIIKKIQPSFFEVTVAMAFDYFAKQKVDIAVIEVGLGGRLDSTNVITPLLSVITNISFDHMDMLGDTLDKIAYEKAGIIKENIPVVIGEKQKPLINNVFKFVAKERKALLNFAEQSVALNETSRKVTYRNLQITINSKSYKIKTSLMPNYQDANIITAFGALQKLSKEVSIDFKKVTEKFYEMPERVKYMGRWQIKSTNPLIILDSAHNEAGIKLALKDLLQSRKKKIHFVLGFVKDKDISKALKLFPKNNAIYYYVKANIPRALDEEILKENATKHHLIGDAYSSVREGFKAAKTNAKKNDIIYVGGSIFVTSEII